MNIIKRTCATCTAFNPAPEVDDPACWNLVSIIEQHGTPQELHRQPMPNDWCDSHKTHEEDLKVTSRVREALGLPAALVDPDGVHRKH